MYVRGGWAGVVQVLAVDLVRNGYLELRAREGVGPGRGGTRIRRREEHPDPRELDELSRKLFDRLSTTRFVHDVYADEGLKRAVEQHFRGTRSWARRHRLIGSATHPYGAHFVPWLWAGGGTVAAILAILAGGGSGLGSVLFFAGVGVGVWSAMRMEAPKAWLTERGQLWSASVPAERAPSLGGDEHVRALEPPPPKIEMPEIIPTDG